MFTYYEIKFIDQKEIDMDLVDIVDSTQTITKCLQLCEDGDQNHFFQQGINIWKTLIVVKDSEDKSFETEELEELNAFYKKMKISLSRLLLSFIDKCSQKKLLEALDVVGSHFEDILNSCDDASIVTSIRDKTCDYRTRLKEIENC